MAADSRPLDFSQRAQMLEMMDDPTVDFETWRACLVDLAKVNRVTLAYRPTMAFLNRIHDAGLWPRDRPVVILDVGSGYGDTLRKVGKWARARSLDVRLQALDSNPWSEKAGERAQGSAGIEFITEDLFDHREGADIVLSSLFTHHLDDMSVIRFLEWQEVNARIGWFINDLERHPFSYYGFSLLARVMLWHRFVVHDGPVSIRRAFQPQDWTVLLAKAGVHQARIEAWFPFRLCVSRVRGER
jgi:SAM-dependent methyltransferase